MRSIAYLIGTAFLVAWLFDLHLLPIDTHGMTAVGTTGVFIAMISATAAWFVGFMYLVEIDTR